MGIKDKIVENLLSKKMWSFCLGLIVIILDGVLKLNLSEHSLELVAYMVIGLCTGDGLTKFGSGAVSSKIKQLISKKKETEETEETENTENIKDSK